MRYLSVASLFYVTLDNSALESDVNLGKEKGVDPFQSAIYMKVSKYFSLHFSLSSCVFSITTTMFFMFVFYELYVTLYRLKLKFVFLCLFEEML